MTCVLVTGVGAVTGHGLLRDLRARRPDVRLVGTDIHATAVGARWCDRFLVCPPAADPGHLRWLRGTVEREQVDLVLPTLDADLDALLRADATADPHAAIGTEVALNSPAAVEVSRDKWALDRLLLDHGEPARIPSDDCADFDRLASSLGVPFLLKPRRGHGSRGILTINDRDELAPHAPRLGTDLFAQQLVGTDEEEYTVGAFGDGTGAVCARIAMRRSLSPGGWTQRAEVVEVPPDLDGVIGRVVAMVAARGPTNLQLRRHDGGWALLEVNARVSSTTPMRALFGYHEAEMTLDHHLLGAAPTQPTLRTGTAARYLEDVVVQ